MDADAGVPSWVPDHARERFVALTQQMPALAAAARFEDVAGWSGWMAATAPDGLPPVAGDLSVFQQALLLQARLAARPCMRTLDGCCGAVARVCYVPGIEKLLHHDSDVSC